MVSLIFGVMSSVAIFPERPAKRLLSHFKIFEFLFFFKERGQFENHQRRESASGTTEMTRSWNETTLPTLLSTYKLEDIFTADEFGLVYQCLPSKTYHLYGEKCSGGKNSKVRLTGMAAASAAGEKLEMFVLGKSKKPRCFKNVRQLPCRYRAQKKSWMAGVLFEEWVRNSTHPFELKAERLPF